MRKPIERSQRGAPRCQGDGGAVLVEFALFAPVLVLLGMGLMEFGFVWRADNMLHTATRAAARVGSNTFALGGDNNDADFQILVAVKSGTAQLEPEDINKVIVYRAMGADGAVPAACEAYDPGTGAGSPGGVACNVYSGAYLAAMSTALADWTGADDGGWEPCSRETDPEVGVDHIGVWVELEHSFITGLFGPSLTMNERSVMALEPSTRDAGVNGDGCPP